MNKCQTKNYHMDQLMSRQLHIGTGLDVAKKIIKKVKGIKRSRNMPVFLRFVVTPQRFSVHPRVVSGCSCHVTSPAEQMKATLSPRAGATTQPNQGLSTQHGFTTVLPFCYLFVFSHEH